jgi:ABC-type transporter Mla subunit MlaD
MKLFSKISHGASKMFNKASDSAPTMYRKFNNTIRKVDNSVARVGNFIANSSDHFTGNKLLGDSVRGITSSVHQTRKNLQNDLEKSIKGNLNDVRDPNSEGKNNAQKNIASI